jgi:hypothetical protein
MTIPTPAHPASGCERITVTTADGRTFDLGNPASKLFGMRLKWYQWQRRHDQGAPRG